MVQGNDLSVFGYQSLIQMSRGGVVSGGGCPDQMLITTFFAILLFTSTTTGSYPIYTIYNPNSTKIQAKMMFEEEESRILSARLFFWQIIIKIISDPFSM